MKFHRLAAIALGLAMLCGAPADAKQPAPAPSLSTEKGAPPERWSADESWGTGDRPTYTFNADGSFVSSTWNNGQSFGRWARHGDAFVMMWTAYQVFYIGTVHGDDIDGEAYEVSGDKMGTFKMHRLAEPATKAP